MDRLLDSTTAPCGAIALADGSVQWRVWAPQADRIDLVLIHGRNRETWAMKREARGYYSFSRDDVPNGQRYVYRLNGGPERPDPASRWQPDGVNQASAVLRTDTFAWSDRQWIGIPREALVFYELHVGTFTPEGSFDAIIPRLPLLRDLGITAVELMPVGQFSGTRNWGYDGVHPFAPQHSYGGPQGLQRLVNACHYHGLAIFLDVVYNHSGPEGSYWAEYGPYFTDHYRTPWGRAVNYDGRGSDPVRAFVLDNVRMWIEDYHFDGLRLDAVHAIYDFGARHILQDIKETADQVGRNLGRHIHIVAESDLNDVRLLLPSERGGYGLDAQWSDDFHHMVHAALTGERQGYYEDYGTPAHFPQLLEHTFVLNGSYSAHRDRRHGGPAAGLSGDRFVVCIQNHDQIGNRAAGERLGTLITRPAQRLAASLLLLAPHLPLLFMGEEYGEEHPFQFFCSFSDPQLIEAVRSGRRREFEAFHTDGAEVPDPQAETTFEASRLTWSWDTDPHKAGLRRLYQDLLHQRRDRPALRNYAERSARMLPHPDSGPVLELIRGGRRHDSEKTIRVLFNLSGEPQRVPKPNMAALQWTSESTQYGGTREATTDKECMLAYECMMFGLSVGAHG
ncbi:MAG TPA: malto-oligosyltrehalose trehalohydrolase [Nitrospiraceae bacterium]|nr:malto-oligosyltrehalose trehalohydrolase [Nitrospiraceae bacterium]